MTVVLPWYHVGQTVLQGPESALSRFTAATYVLSSSPPHVVYMGTSVLAAVQVPNNAGPVGRFSPELKDLLDKMFDVKQVRE